MWTNGLQLAGAGTAFPALPTPNDVFLRTDLNTLFYWDGTNGHWYTVNEQTMALPRYGCLPGGSASATTCLGTYSFGGNWNPSSILVTKWVADVYQATLPTNSLKVAFALKTDDGLNVSLIDSGFDTYNGGSGNLNSRWARYSRPQSYPAATGISSQVAATIYVTATVTGATAYFDAHAISYRLGI